MQKMVRDLRRLKVALGSGVKEVLAAEASAIEKMGKKLVAARDLPAGHRLEREDVAIKSPGNGLHPYELDRIIGRRLTRSVCCDGNISFEALDADE
jgi:N-acetylneuraminate synthase/sialic acid synthase